MPGNKFRLAPIMIKILFTFYKSSYLNEEVNCTEPSPLVSIPWQMHNLTKINKKGKIKRSKERKI